MPNRFRQLPPLNALVAFEAAFRLQSFTRAADELALSQGSVSRRVRELERNLGVQLFERRRYDVVPTADGETLAATVRVSLSDLTATAELVRNRQTERTSLTIFSDLSLANALVAPVLGEFQRLHPELQLRVISSSVPIEYIDEGFDIGLQYGRRAEEKFTIEPIADEVIFPVCSPGLAAQLPPAAGPIEVAKLPLLHFSDPNREWPSWQSFLAAFLHGRAEANSKGLVFSSYQISLDVAEKGEGIALGWGRTVKARLDAGSLVRVSDLAIPIADGINIYRIKGARPNPREVQFLELLHNKIEPVD